MVECLVTHRSAGVQIYVENLGEHPVSVGLRVGHGHVRADGHYFQYLVLGGAGFHGVPRLHPQAVFPAQRRRRHGVQEHVLPGDSSISLYQCATYLHHG